MRLTPIQTESLAGLAPYTEQLQAEHDPVDHPSHYTSHPSGVEAITITEHFSFNVGNAVKYLWRAELKNVDPFQDLAKAAWYINREIDRLTVLLQLGDYTNEELHVREEAP